MRDGVRLAVDVHVPKPLGQGERTATILHMSRYFRSLKVRGLFKTVLGFGPYAWTESDVREQIVKAGYSWVDVDVRGSGASFGSREYPLSADEVADGGEMIDWIVSQPWSAGVVGATGTSYDGTLAQLLVRNRHPALKAIAPRFSVWDVYGDIFLPGGLWQSGLLHEWSRLTAALDRNKIGDFFGWRASMMIGGIQPVDPALLEAAVAEHVANVDIERLLGPVAYRDDTKPDSGLTIDSFSPHTLDRAPASSDVAVYGYTGWLDGAHARSQARQFASRANLDARDAVGPDGSTVAASDRLLLGPWFHGGKFNASRYASGRNNDFDHAAEMIRFFDYHLRGIDNGFTASRPVRYYTMGEERWKTSDTWPPAGAQWRSFFLGSGGKLEPAGQVAGGVAAGAARAQVTAGPDSGNSAEAHDAYEVDPTTTTGKGSRWGLIVGTGEKRQYKDRRNADERLLTYTTPPLTEPIEVTGHPIVRLYMSANADDAGVFVYLEDVHPNGEVTYVTEGQLRAIHRRLSPSPIPNDPVPFRSFLRADSLALVPGEVAELVFDLLPTSFLFQEGHAIRVAIAGADADQFTAPLPVSPLIYEIHRDAAHPSRIELPTYPVGHRGGSQ